MRFIIIGCGRTGSTLARLLALRGHAVTVVDHDPLRFDRLGSAFSGKTVIGIGFDRDVLIQAGIERADGLAAVTESDETNIVAARMASMVFRVPKVFARLFDPRKVEIYQRLGLQTIAPVSWAANRVADLLCGSQFDTMTSLGSGQVDLVQVEAPFSWVGRTVSQIVIPGEVQVVTISRGGKTFLPTQGTLFQAGDWVHLAILTAAADRIKAILELD